MKNIGEKVLGWFVVAEDDASAEDASDRIEEPSPAEAPVARAKAHAVRPAEGSLAKFLDLLDALPDAATPEVKRAIVVASLEAFGISVDGVVAAAAEADAALDAQSAEIAETKRQLEAQARAQEERAKSVAREKARLRRVAAFFAKS